MKKRILMSLMVIGLVSALVGGATFAIFTDSAVNQNNSFTAGTVNIALDREGNLPLFGAPGTALVDATNLYPGWTGQATIDVSNAGSLPIEWFAYVEQTSASTPSLAEVLQVRVECTEVGGDPVKLDWTPLSQLLGNSSTTMADARLKWDGDVSGAHDPAWDNLTYTIKMKIDSGVNNDYQGAFFNGNLVFKAFQYPN